MADRLSADRKYINVLARKSIPDKDVLGLKTNGENIDIYMLAFALGVKAGYKTSSDHKEGFVQESAARGKDLALSFIHSVALQDLLKENKESSITNTDVVFEIAEGYVNTGFSILANMVPDFSKYDEEALIYEIIEKLDEEIAHLL
jgi:hypothetical protein